MVGFELSANDKYTWSSVRLRYVRDDELAHSKTSLLPIHTYDTTTVDRGHLRDPHQSRYWFGSADEDRLYVSVQ